MRILFTTWAWPTHLYAMVPLAWACRNAGHDVLVASQPALTDVMLRTGLPSAVVGRDVDAVGTFRDIVFTPSAPPGQGGGPPKPGGGGGGGPRVMTLLTELAEAMVDDLVALASRWRADLVVFEPTAFAGPLAAAVVGIPAVRHLFGTDLMSVLGRFLPPALNPVGERYGLDNVDPFGAATVDPYPAGLQVPVGSRRLPIRYVPYNGAGVAPPPAPPSRSGRPRVCVTWGTTLGRLDDGLFLAGEIVRAVADLDIELVVAITAEQRGMLGPVPDGVRVVESAPLHLVVPTCDAMIAHGGAGSILAGITHGLPQLLVPRLPDHVRHADRLAEVGAGVVVPARSAEPSVIATALTKLLDSPGYREAAIGLRDELAGQPTPPSVVTELERIVAAQR